MATFFEKRLTQLERAGITPEIVERIRAHIENAEPPGLIQISPYRMADEWNLPHREVLEAFLYGTRLGIFDLIWHIRCPSCKVAIEPTTHLAWLRSNAHCKYCQIDFQVGFDDAVEVTFGVSQDVRSTDQNKWLQTDEHICKIDPVGWVEVMKYWGWIETKTPLKIEPQSAWKHRIKMKAGTYYLHGNDFFKLFVPLPIEGDPIHSVQHVNILFDGERLTKTDPQVYHPGVLIVHITNTSDYPVDLTFSRRKPYSWISAAQIASTQTFRDLFSSEVISLDETFSLHNAVFVFTDIKGSTALCERLGDSETFFVVKEHFKILTRKIREHNGAAVKKIGDVLMATFLVPEDAMNALFEIQRAFEEFNVQENIRNSVIIKAGAHQGPCIAVTLNDRLDYFGRTVNIAARVQRLSTGNDILLSQSFYADPAVQEIVENSGWQIREFQATLGSIEDIYDVVQLLPPTLL
jgi:adenylate cyclase